MLIFKPELSVLAEILLDLKLLLDLKRKFFNWQIKHSDI